MIFTDKGLRALLPREKEYSVREGRGFAIRVLPSGAKTWYYIYHWHGKKKYLPLGHYPEVDLKTARAKYRDALIKVENGIDPLAVAKAGKEAPTVSDLIDDYVERWARPNKRSWEEDKRNLERDVRPVLGDALVTEVTRRDVIALLDRIIARGAPRQSNIVYSVMRRMFNFALEQNYPGLEYSPCDRVKLRIKDTMRERTLSADEIKVFWTALPKTGVSSSALRILRLILITAQRPGEVAGMTWGEIDGRWWTIPAARSKNKREQRVYLTDLALEILGERGTGPVVPSPVTGRVMHVSQVAQALRRLLPKQKETAKLPPETVTPQKKKTAPLQMEPFTPHDLRRTAATRMAESGIEAYAIDRILGHSQGVLRQTYNKYQYDKEKQAALTAWEHRLQEIIT